MTKQSGLGDNLYVSGYDLSGRIASIDSISTPVATIDVTDITQEAVSRIPAMRDGKIDCTTLFDPVHDVHTVLSALPSTDRHLMYCRGTTLGAPAACMVAKQIGFDPTRAQSGEVTLKTSAVANSYGLEWGVLLTSGKRTDTAATNGSSVDTLASAAHGFQAYLQVFAFSGTDVTVKLQDSADDSSWSDITSGAFMQVTSGPQVQRIAVADGATVRRYVRAVTTTSAGVTSCTFAVALIKNVVAGVFG